MTNGYKARPFGVTVLSVLFLIGAAAAATILRPLIILSPAMRKIHNR
jgi:hypothetical protein